MLKVVGLQRRMSKYEAIEKPSNSIEGESSNVRPEINRRVALRKHAESVMRGVSTTIRGAASSSYRFVGQLGGILQVLPTARSEYN
ncbi:hypothetical protein HNY73_013788 [Argiope bruennichi]|uniref:Uncharacterized protein n=1 Tax=Argiope bruennichi TaxID=94029 RepID=A0A8T0ER43_ARGBR|nr:hypothetical protein HNY73_013788 [Argiope bruennichi]